ncbi:MAG: hypothetical protein NC191_06655 [Muribaculaceae bacterium]|nr:hypothetical protein [Muribaculaceae bacterium]
MAVEGSKNLPNQNMHYGVKNVVGIIDDVPNKINKRSFYSKEESIKLAEKSQHDAYVKRADTFNVEKGEFPLVLKILGGVIGAASLVFWHKSIWKGLVNFVKNLPK